MTEMTINGIDIVQYGARLLDYTVSGTNITNNKFDSGKLGVPAQLHSRNYSEKTLTIVLTFKAPGGRKIPLQLNYIATNKQLFDKQTLADECQITLPDGFLYRACISSLGEVKPTPNGEVDCTYTFTAVQCKPLETISVTNAIQYINCKSAVPVPCSIAVTNNNENNTLANFQELGFKVTIYYGETIVLDGQKKTITINGENAFMRTIGFIDFPVLQPGKQKLTLSTYVTTANAVSADITYYPTFV